MQVYGLVKYTKPGAESMLNLELIGLPRPNKLACTVLYTHLDSKTECFVQMVGLERIPSLSMQASTE